MRIPNIWRRKFVVLAASAIVLHLAFLASSYNPNFVSGLSVLGNSTIVERILMIAQFFPLIVTLLGKKSSRRKELLFLMFSICLSTLYVVDDFNTGFYGALVRNGDGIMPRMRSSAHLQAYAETGHLVTLDPHAEYFLEFLIVNVLSNVAGLNYILVYGLVMRLAAITIWSLLFVWASNRVKGSHREIWLLLLAATLMLANAGYNYEWSFAPMLLLIFYLLVTRTSSRQNVVCTLLAGIGVLSASFRETFLLVFICVGTICITPIITRFGGHSPESRHSNSVLFAMLSVLGIARISLFTATEYTTTYVNYFSNLTQSILKVLRGQLTFNQQTFATLSYLRDVVNQRIALVSVVSLVLLLSAVAILSLVLVFFSRNRNGFSFIIGVLFLLALAVPVSAYLVLKISGTGPLRDFTSATVLARTSAPLAVLALSSILSNKARINTRFTRLWIIAAVCLLSVLTVFAPFAFLRGDVKTSFDARLFPGNEDEYLVLGNSAYHFTLSHFPVTMEYRILSPATGWLQHYYLLPLRYNLGKDIATGKYDESAIGLTFASRVFDNELFMIFNHGQSVFLNESLSGGLYKPEIENLTSISSSQ